MVRDKSEILDYLKGKMGDELDDESIAFLEDISDTLDDYDSKVHDTEDWKTKYEENDKEWRKKYTDRFFSGEPEEESEGNPKDESGKSTPMTFDDLFTQG